MKRQLQGRSRVFRLTRALGLAGLLALVSVLTAVPATASTTEAPFGYQPPSIFLTDNNTLTHRSIECTTADFLHFNHYMHFSYKLDYNPTDLNTVELSPGCNSYQSQDDNIWYATKQSNLPGLGATGAWKCQWSTLFECNRGLIRLNEAMRTDGTSEAIKWNTACHEIAHGVGFDHGDTGNNCMDGGGGGNLDAYMINQINGTY